MVKEGSKEALRRAAGQMLIVGFHGTETLPEVTKAALEVGEVGGVILFRRNVVPGAEGLLTLARLNAAVHACTGDGELPPFVALDQEGGRVMRIRDGVSAVPPMLAVGDHNDVGLAQEMGALIASEVGALGFNLNFAPVLDVFTNPENKVIGDRALSRAPEAVAALALAVAKGHLERGVVPCGKHFPGHGDTVADSHYELPVIAHDRARLDAVELVPFVDAIRADIPMLMTAHILVPKLDPVHPMTLSKVGLSQILREELGYEGVVITDDLEMNAVAERYTIEEMVELGIEAGIDIFLICHTEALWKRAHARIVALATEDDAVYARVMRSAARIRHLKDRILSKGAYRAPEALHSLQSQVATPEHAALIGKVLGSAQG